MRYPNFIKDNDTVGFIASSCGSNKNPYRALTHQGIINYQKMNNIKIKKGHRIFRQYNGVSGPHTLRADDFNKMYKNKHINLIWSTGGGEIMMGMLPYVDFEKIKKLPPKYFVGFSDNTNLTFTLTTICDVATIYGSGIGNFALNELQQNTKDLNELMFGRKLSFDSYPFYNGEKSREITYDDIFAKKVYLDEVAYKSLDNQNHEIQGRFIGGCIDILVCLCGTSFDNVKAFNEKYKDDGIIWYFDVCDLDSCGFYRALFQLENAGWFKYVKGFVIGRFNNPFENLDYSFVDVMRDCLSKYNVPVIYDVDITHKSPALPVINGAIANIKYENGKGNITYILK